MRTDTMKSTKFWAVLIGVVLVLSVAAAAGVYLWRGVGTMACIYQNGTLIERINLDTVTSPYELTVTDRDGGENVISVEPGRIRISDANCPDHVCVDTGWISDGVIPIVCLPHQLVIRIEGGGNSDIDIAVQ